MYKPLLAQCNVLQLVAMQALRVGFKCSLNYILTSILPNFWLKESLKLESYPRRGFDPRIKPSQVTVPFTVYCPFHFFEFCFKQIIYFITEDYSILIQVSIKIM